MRMNLPGHDTNKKTGTKKAVLEFTEMMELLIGAGLSLKDALELFTAINRNSRGDLLGRRLSDLINRGFSFAQAVRSMEDTFSPIYRGMIRVGDKVGSVESIFPRLSSYLRDQKKMRDKISAALAYPILVLAVSILGGLGLVFFVLPKLQAIFAGFGGNEGGRIEANIRSMETVLLAFVVLLILGVSVVLALRKTGEQAEETACLLDGVLLRLPLIGGFIASWESLNFSFAMEVLTGGGVSVETAIDEAADVVSNRAYRRALKTAREKIINGGNIAGAFSGERIFPVYMSRWLSIGERSGKTENIFSRIRFYFQGEIERRTSQFVLLIEPAMIVVVGVVMLWIVGGIILPLFSMYGSIF
jgi:type II secretory pathway component PulF